MDELRKIPGARHIDQVALVVPLPAVEGTHEGVDTTFVVGKTRSSVHAGIVKCANLAVLATNDDE